jgi:hypothetical protein
MAPLTPADVRRPVAYWPIRAQERRRMVELRRNRRLMLGDLVSLVFENRDTADELGEAERTPTVRYVRFRIDPAEQSALRHAGTNVAVVVDHPRYSTRTVLTPLQREALAADLADP